MRIATPPSSPVDGIALRQIEPADCAAWYDYLRLPDVFGPTSWNVRSADELQVLVASYLRDDPESPLRLAVVDVTSGRLAGTIGLHTRSAANRGAEIAYDLAPSHWGRGLATALCDAVATWSFETLGVHRLQATVLVGNARSERVLARCGFRHEGLLRGLRMVRGQPGDFNLYARLSTDTRKTDGHRP